MVFAAPGSSIQEARLLPAPTLITKNLEIWTAL